VTIHHHGVHAIIKEGGALGENFCDLIRLIRSIHRIEGNPDCFATAENTCEQSGCAWREYCLTRFGRAGLPGETTDETAHRFGKMLGYAYSLHDNTFDANWELVN
jgi:hypothetical protein